jgi:thiamine-monophosphate kinase
VDVGDDEDAHEPSISAGAPYNGLVKVSDLGEFGLIRRLASAIGAGPAELIVGIGDDAAVWRLGDRVILATTDTLVEGVHFLPNGAPWRDLGWKSLAVNVSDIAAMGGRPLFALVTLALLPDTDVAAMDDLYAGLNDCARRYGVTIAGGDIVRAPQVSVTVALLGEAQQRDGTPLLLRRDAARAGDVIAVTGALGDAAAGLRRLKEGAAPGDPLPRAHLHPQPPLAAGEQAAAAGVVCGIDVSDGLLQDVGHICEMSRVGAAIRTPLVPLSDALRDAYPEDALALACSGGEDYQLVLAGPRHIIERLQSSLDARLTVIGEITPGAGPPHLVDASGRELSLASPGWDQLR